MASILFPSSLGFRDAIPFRGNPALTQPGPPPPGPISLADNCVFTPTMGGLTDFSVSSAVLGSLSPINAGAIIGSRYHYAARSADQTQWEIGLGTCRGEYISRDSVILSSNNNQPVNFSVVPTVSLDALAEDFGGVRRQRSVTTTPIVILQTDQILNCNIPVPPSCQLPPSASRNGVPLTFKVVGGNANFTFTFFGTETADAQSVVNTTTSFAGITFVPFADGVNTGYSIE